MQESPPSPTGPSNLPAFLCRHFRIVGILVGALVAFQVSVSNLMPAALARCSQKLQKMPQTSPYVEGGKSFTLIL